MKKFRVHLGVITWIFLLLAWYIATSMNIFSETILPSPQLVLERFMYILQNGYNKIPFLVHLGISFKRLFIAIILATVTAIPTGLLSGYNEKVREALDSMVQFYRPIPPLAYYVLLVIWLGIEEESKIMLLFLAGFAPIYLTCVSAVTNVKEDFINNAKSLGANNKQIFFNVVLPSALPQIFVGIRTAFGFAYTTLVSAEMVAASSGIGWMVIDANRYLKTDVIFVGIIVMGITGILMDYGLLKLENKIVFWKGKD